MQLALVFLILCLFRSGICQTYAYEEPWGRDAGIERLPRTEPSFHSLSVQIAHQVIRFHQTIISPIDGPRSSFRPSSSQYMKIAMENYGFWKGFLMGFDRLMRENGEEWVYRTVEENGQSFKYDPAQTDKYR